MPQAKRGSSRKAKADDDHQGERELVVITDPGAGIRATPSGLEASGVDAAPLEGALADASFQPLFAATEDRARNADAPLDDGAGGTTDLGAFYRVAAEDDRLDDLAEELMGAEGIVAAYVKPPAEPAVESINDMVASDVVAPPATPDFSARQIYLDASPEGIDARWAWTVPGGRGAGVRIIDIEGAWRFDHEDLVVNQGGVVGVASTDLGWRNHGTAVVGEYGGDVNAFGVTGICADAHCRGFSIFGGKGSARAIREAADALSPGDIILIELHRPGPGASGAGQDGFIAIEWWEDDFQAIRYAFNRGVIVVEAAGNGTRNLDDPIYNTPAAGFPPGWTNPFNRANRDSGAIVVGAGAPPPGTHGRDHGPDRSRLGFSNWGALVDAQGWGREVTTCGYGDLQGGADENLWYTDTFSGTSSASPIVVGALGCVQGIRRARGQAPWTPAQARARLRATGSPQTDAPGRPATQRIGNRPNLRELVGRGKPIKEFKEKVEIKERIKEKPEKEKLELKERAKEKIEIKERIKEIEKVKDKNIHDKRKDKSEKEIYEHDWRHERFRGGGPSGEEDVAERLAAVEASIGELAHFITEAMRPDLSGGALTGEEDAGWFGGEPEQLG